MMNMMKVQIKMRQDEEEAWLLLMSIVKQGNILSVFAEVDRRAAMFKKNWEENIRGHHCTVRCAALRSVRNDVVIGYLS